MGTIRNRNFFTLVANDIGKSPKLVSNYFDAVVDRIVKEALRGNSVSIKNFGFIRPKVYGGKEMNICGEMKYVEPKLVLKYEMSDIMLSRLNKDEFTKDEIKDLDMIGVTNVDKQVPLGKQKRDKRNLSEMFDVIKEELEKKYQCDNCDDDEEEDF